MPKSPEKASARLQQISVNPRGGVPKMRVARAWLTANKVEGDRQNWKLHGGPMRAVCLWSAELIIALREAGHPISPGSTGENLTISGLQWDEITPGTQLQIGAARLEITEYARPCAKISASFSDGDWNRIYQETHRGWSRLYAKVLVDAAVFEGDDVEIVDDIG